MALYLKFLHSVFNLSLCSHSAFVQRVYPLLQVSNPRHWCFLPGPQTSASPWPGRSEPLHVWAAPLMTAWLLSTAPQHLWLSAGLHTSCSQSRSICWDSLCAPHLRSCSLDSPFIPGAENSLNTKRARQSYNWIEPNKITLNWIYRAGGSIAIKKNICMKFNSWG